MSLLTVGPRGALPSTAPTSLPELPASPSHPPRVFRAPAHAWRAWAGLGLSKGRKGCGPGCLAAGVAATRYTVKVEPARRQSAPSCRRIAALGRAWRSAPPPAARQSQAGPTIRSHPSAPLAAPLPGCLAALAAPRHAADCHYTATLPALGRLGPRAGMPCRPWARRTRRHHRQQAAGDEAEKQLEESSWY